MGRAHVGCVALATAALAACALLAQDDGPTSQPGGTLSWEGYGPVKLGMKRQDIPDQKWVDGNAWNYQVAAPGPHTFVDDVFVWDPNSQLWTEYGSRREPKGRLWGDPPAGSATTSVRLGFCASGLYNRFPRDGNKPYIGSIAMTALVASAHNDVVHRINLTYYELPFRYGQRDNNSEANKAREFAEMYTTFRNELIKVFGQPDAVAARPGWDMQRATVLPVVTWTNPPYRATFREARDPNGRVGVFTVGLEYERYCDGCRCLATSRPAQ